MFGAFCGGLATPAKNRDTAKLFSTVSMLFRAAPATNKQRRGRQGTCRPRRRLCESHGEAQDLQMQSLSQVAAKVDRGLGRHCHPYISPRARERRRKRARGRKRHFCESPISRERMRINESHYKEYCVLSWLKEPEGNTFYVPRYPVLLVAPYNLHSKLYEVHQLQHHHLKVVMTRTSRNVP
ncbi:hypothetical protein VTK73DRAFT_2115 [Phialemonium thermophilum]|uniref:Uncharacterized protein n=1 Tax=Phialemonium thermophilum TaxID=223376 RepID=A0ABR3X6D2_9PEZI